MEYYLTVEQYGDTIFERYIDNNGKERTREVKYQPSLFYHAPEGVETNYKDIYGKFAKRKQFDSIREARDWMKRMNAIGQEVMGMDDFKLAYISDTYGSEIAYNRNHIRVANCDIEVTAAEFPSPDQALYEIDAITHYDSIDDKFYVFDLLNSAYGRVSKWSPQLAVKSEAEGGDELDPELAEKVVYLPFETEEELLLEYLRLWEEKTPVIFTGWNVEGFDIPYIVNRITNLFGPKVAARLSPCRRIQSKVINNMYGEKTIHSILGITILDYMDLYKKFSFTNQPTYNLDYIAEYETGKGKLPYDGPINKLRETNHNRYISYNIQDVNCVQAIDKIRQFIELSLSLGYYSKMQIQSVFSPIKTWDAIIYNSLKTQKKVIPECKSHVRQSYPGAYVKEPVPNFYKWGMSFDLTSLYPSIIRQVNISPETIVGTFPLSPMADYIAGTAPRPSDEYSCSPNGWMYDKSFKGVIPEEIEKVFFQRKEWKNKMLAAKRNLELIKKAKHSHN
ncbi:DNA polymerase [Providencia phage PSTCR6]|nr:DNA polymerase [Providencia phage PSTCR6]